MVDRNKPDQTEPEEYSVIGEALSMTGDQLAAMFDESPFGKIVTWWNAPAIPYSETSSAEPGKSFRDTHPEWTVEGSIKSKRRIKFAGMEFTGEQFLQAYGGDQRIMDYLNESGGPTDLEYRIEAYSKELENMGKISEAGVAGWSGYFISNMVLDPTNLVFTGAVMDIVNTGRAAKRFKQLIDAGEEVTPEQAYALYRGMTGQTIKQTMLKGGIAGVGSMAVESYFDKKVTTGDVLMAGALSMGLAGLIGGIASARRVGVSQLQGQARLYFDDIMSETTSEVPTRLDANMGVDEVQAVLTAEASKRMNRFIREGIEAGRPMQIVAEEAIQGFNKMQQMVSRFSTLTFSDGKTISDLQTSEARTVRTLYAVLGNHRLSFQDADAQLIETVSDMNARRNMAIDGISNEIQSQGSRYNHGIGRDKMAGLVIRQMEGRLDETAEDFFVKSNGNPMTEMEIQDVKETAIYLANKLRGEVYVEYEALAGITGMRDPIDNYHPRTGRLRENLENEGTVDLFKNKYREYLNKHIEEGKLEMSEDQMEAHINNVVASMKSGKQMKPGETTFDYSQKDNGELELIERDGSEFFTQKVSETGEMQRRSLVGPTGKDGKPIDIPYDIMEDLYPNAHDHLIGSAKRHSATTNGAILSAIGAPKGQSLPEFRTAEQPLPEQVATHAEDMTNNIIPAGKAAESDNPAQFLEDTRPVVDELNAASKNMETAKEKEANSNMAVDEAIEAKRGKITDSEGRQIADVEWNLREIQMSSKDEVSSFKEWDKAEKQLDRLESKETRILDRFESEKARAQTRLDELEAKQRESQEQGHVPVQPDAFELNQVTDEIAKLLKQDTAKKGKHQERVFNKIGKTQKEIDVLEAQRILLEWEIGGRKYDAEDTSTVLTGEIYGLTRTTIKQAQELLGENASVKQILKNFTTRDTEKALELVNRQLQKKSEELNTRIKDYDNLEPQGLTGKSAEKLEKLKARHEELLEHIRVHGDKTPAEYRRSLERTRQEKIDVLRRTLDEWGDPIKDGELSKAFRDHVGDRAGRFEELLGDFKVLRDTKKVRTPDGKEETFPEGSLALAREISQGKMVAYEDAVRRLDEDLDADRLNKWLKKNGSDAVKKEIQELKDQLKARRAERQQNRGELSEARKRLQKASKDYTDTFGERHTLDEEVDLAKVNSRISSIRTDSAMRSMSMGIGRQDGKYVPLSYGYGKEINDEYARMIEDAGDDAALVEKLERSRDADFQKLGELRDSFLGQNGKDQASDSIVLGSQFLTSANIAINSLADIAPTVAKSNASTLQTAESFVRSLTSTLVSLMKDAIGAGASRNTVAQFAEAVEIESMKTSMSGRASTVNNQGSVRLSPEELQRSKHNLRGKISRIWSMASLFNVVQPLVRGVAGRLHTTRALDLGRKIFYGEALSKGEAMYVRKMGMTNDELSSSYVAWVKHGGNESVTGSGLKSANPDEWGDKALGKKFKAGVMRQVEASSLKPRKEDRMIKGGGGVKRLRNAPGFSKMDEYDKDGVFINNAINSLLSFPRTAFKEYGMKSIQHIWSAYQSKDLAGSFKMARNVLIGGSIYYAVHNAKKESRDSLGLPKRPSDPLFGSEEADNLLGFLSYTGLFGTLLDIPRTLKYAKSDYERGERSFGPAFSALATGIGIASPGFSGMLQVVDGMKNLSDLLRDPKVNENDVRRHLRRYGFSPLPVRSSTVLNPIFDVLIEDAVDHGVVEKVIKGDNK